MSHDAARRWLPVLIILIPVLILAYVLITSAQQAEKPKAKNGEIDLSQWNFADNGNLPLNGEWKFYWNQLLVSSTETSAQPVSISVFGNVTSRSIPFTVRTAAGRRAPFCQT